MCPWESHLHHNVDSQLNDSQWNYILFCVRRYTILNLMNTWSFRSMLMEIVPLRNSVDHKPRFKERYHHFNVVIAWLPEWQTRLCRFHMLWPSVSCLVALDEECPPVSIKHEVLGIPPIMLVRNHGSECFANCTVTMIYLSGNGNCNVSIR